MKLYLAGNYNIMNIIGRERVCSKMFPVWRRLYSYFFLHLIIKSEILNIIKEENENTSSISRTSLSSRNKKNSI